jgi:hypothetical protein
MKKFVCIDCFDFVEECGHTDKENMYVDDDNEKLEDPPPSHSLFGAFDWKTYRQLEKSISPIEEKVIRQQMRQIMEGNDYCDEFGTSETNIAFDFFRYGWICARLAVS